MSSTARKRQWGKDFLQAWIYFSLLPQSQAHRVFLVLHKLCDVLLLPWLMLQVNCAPSPRRSSIIFQLKTLKESQQWFLIKLKDILKHVWHIIKHHKMLWLVVVEWVGLYFPWLWTTFQFLQSPAVTRDSWCSLLQRKYSLTTDLDEHVPPSPTFLVWTRHSSFNSRGNKKTVTNILTKCIHFRISPRFWWGLWRVLIMKINLCC